jgi:hypothetical protein
MFTIRVMSTFNSRLLVKLIYCQVKYTKFKVDLIKTSSDDLLNSTKKKSMFKLDSYENFIKSNLKSCIDIFEHIIVILKYHYVRCKKASFMLIYLQQRCILSDKIPNDKLETQLLVLGKVYSINLRAL